MASNAIFVVIFSLAAFVAAEAAVKPLPEVPVVADMKSWLDSLRIDTEKLRDSVWNLVIDGSTNRADIEERKNALTKLIFDIIAVRKQVNQTTSFCDSSYFVDYIVEKCQADSRKKWLPKLNELAATHAEETKATEEFIAQH